MSQPNPLKLDLDGLRSLASERIVRRGIDYFKEHRVTHITFDERSIQATVAGSDPHLPYTVDLTLDEDDEILVDCSCPFDWEPACKHAVAALLAYAARQPVDEIEVESAADEAVVARVKRGRSEVVVQHEEGDRWFGAWSAQSLESRERSLPPWRVEIRSVGERMNHCTCPDFATNRLGTCKHIEAVLHKLRSRAPHKFERLARQGPPIPVVHLAWDLPEAPRVRVHRPAKLGEPLAELLDRHFDDRGLLRGDPPQAFFRFQREAAAHREILVASDAMEWVHLQAEEAQHRLRAQAIRREIGRSGGHLPGVRARLYPYQIEGTAFLAAAGRALLADDMGLGKTIQAIAAAAWLREHEGARRALVICPASLKHQWKREIERFTGQEVTVVQGGARLRGAQYGARSAFTVVNYELVLRDASVIQETLAPDLLILDEAQRIKNWRTQSAAAVKSIQTRWAFVLTGTPLENRLEDLYSLMQVVDPRVLGPLWRYLLDFHVTDPRGRVLGYRNLSELRRRLRALMLRRDRVLVRDQLPDRIQHQLDVPLDRKQRELHDDAVQAAGSLAARMKHRPLTPHEEKMLMAALQRARMACDAAGLVDKETVGSPKLDELSRLLEDLCVDGGHKVVIFSQWERMTAMAEERVRKLGLGFVRLHGGVPTKRRGELLDRFRDDPSVRVFLSTDAGGVGLNLQAASALINLDMPWNPAVLEQRIARVHRLGQKEPVQVVLLVAQDAYEARVASLVASKQFLFDNVVRDDASEDVVGVSRRSVELALEALGVSDDDGEEAREEADGGEREAAGAGVSLAAEAESAYAEGEGDESTQGERANAAGERPRRDEPEPGPDLGPLVEGLQHILGTRLERILGLGQGLLAVVDAVEDEHAKRVRDLVHSLDLGVKVELLDARSAAALARLGAVAGEAVYERPEEPVVPAPLLAQASRKLEAAEILHGQGHGEEALELMLQAMLHAAAHRASLDAAPRVEEAAVWIFGEAVPKGHIDLEDANAITRAVALAQVPQVPAALLGPIQDDARRLVGREVATA